MKAELKAKEQELLEKLGAESDAAKTSMLEEFRARLTGGTPLTDGERQQLLDEMSDRLERMDGLLAREKGEQGRHLEDMLALRRKKKEDLKTKFTQVQAGADSKDKEFSDKLI